MRTFVLIVIFLNNNVTVIHFSRASRAFVFLGEQRNCLQAFVKPSGSRALELKSEVRTVFHSFTLLFSEFL